MQEIPKISFNQIAKQPVTYALIVAVSLLWFVAYMFKDSSNQVNTNCEAEKVELRKENAQYKADKDALTTALLIKNGIILQQAQDQKELDSTIRTKVGQKATKIVKEK
ncbi:hypothetical protein [Pedobacter sp.]|uniref:hypothetical protein n=1 Tax=Pedobacter sp. TaxID=1411316 RepID=UPI003D7FFDE0